MAKKIIIFLVIVSLLGGSSFLIMAQGEKGQRVKVELFTMSQCHFGVLAENALIQAKEKFGDKIKIEIYFIAEEEDSKFISFHGEEEIKEEIRQLIIAKYYPEEFLGYLESRNTAYRDSNWRAHAIDRGIDVKKVERISESRRGRNLLRKNIKRAEKLKIKSSPTIYINGELYEGPISTPSITLEICKKLGKELALCEALPECFSDEDCKLPRKDGKCLGAGTKQAKCEFSDALRIEVINLVSEACLGCEVHMVLNDIRRRYRGINVRDVDINSEEGAKLISELKIEALPALLFGREITEHKGFESDFKNGLFSKLEGGNYYLFSPQILPPRLFFRRELKPNTLDLFVMSQCLIGINAEEVLINKARENKFKLNIHYIINKDEKGIFHSLHGKEELREDIEQIVIQKHYPDKFFDYLLCRNKDIKDRDWQKCAEELKLDPEKIKVYAYEEHLELLAREVKLTQELNIKSSPTFLWENRLKISEVSDLRKIKGFEDVKIKRGRCR